MAFGKIHPEFPRLSPTSQVLLGRLHKQLLQEPWRGRSEGRTRASQPLWPLPTAHPTPATLLGGRPRMEAEGQQGGLAWMHTHVERGCQRQLLASRAKEHIPPRLSHGHCSPEPHDLRVVPGELWGRQLIPQRQGQCGPGDAGNMRLSGHGATHRTAREGGLGDGTPAAGTKPPGTPAAGTKPPSLQAFPFLHLVSQRRASPGKPVLRGPGRWARLAPQTFRAGRGRADGRRGCGMPWATSPSEAHNLGGRDRLPPHQSQGVVGSLQQVQRIAPSAQCERPAPCLWAPASGGVHAGPDAQAARRWWGQHPRQPEASLCFCTFQEKSCLTSHFS